MLELNRFLYFKYTSYRDSISYLRSAIHYGAYESDTFANQERRTFVVTFILRLLDVFKKLTFLVESEIKNTLRFYVPLSR